MERIYGFVIFCLGAGIMWQGRYLSKGSLHAPGPGFFPTIVAVTMIILSLFLIFFGGKKENERKSFSGKSSLRVLIVFVALLIYFFLLEYLGFVIVSFLLMTFLFGAFGSQRWHMAVLWAFISVGLAYLLFEVLLVGNLPKGLFGV